jgi:hypothetical protein
MYVSISFSHFDDLCESNSGHVIKGVSVCEKVYSMPFWVKMTKTGNWIIDNITPTCILTEKINCLYYLDIKNSKLAYINKFTSETRMYKITKFFLLNNDYKLIPFNINKDKNQYKLNKPIRVGFEKIRPCQVTSIRCEDDYCKIKYVKGKYDYSKTVKKSRLR